MTNAVVSGDVMQKPVDAPRVKLFSIFTSQVWSSLQRRYGWNTIFCKVDRDESGVEHLALNLAIIVEKIKYLQKLVSQKLGTTLGIKITNVT